MVKLAKVAQSKLTWKCCSGDETDDENQQVITSLPWRSQSIRHFMQKINQLYYVLRFTLNNQASHGKFPKPRYNPLTRDPPRQLNEDRYCSDVVPGLPLNFYDEAWVNSLDPLERQSLNATNAVDLTLPPDIQQ
jgi:hypothetical protein